MKKFKFSLEKVLEIKEIEEKIIQKALLTIQREIFETETIISRLSENVTNERVKICKLNQSITTSKDIMLHQKHIENLENKIQFLRENLITLRINEETTRNQLIAKSREKKAIDRLKEIKYEEFRKNYKKEQQLFIDDISIQTHRFKTGSA
jgi:flagellar FliJ protein